MSERRDLFATPVWSTRLDDVPGRIGALTDAIARLRSSGDDGGQRSNTDGTWQSTNKLFAEEPFRTLAADIGAFVTGTVAADLRLRRGTELGMNEMWANTAPPGGRHRLHHHGNAYLSGVYYVTTPADCGGLVVHDPRDGAPILGRYWELSSELTDLTDPAPAIVPEAGELHVFHAWLRHEVQVNRSSSDRVALSFNFIIQSVPS